MSGHQQHNSLENMCFATPSCTLKHAPIKAFKTDRVGDFVNVNYRNTKSI